MDETEKSPFIIKFFKIASDINSIINHVINLVSLYSSKGRVVERDVLLTTLSHLKKHFKF